MCVRACVRACVCVCVCVCTREKASDVQMVKDVKCESDRQLTVTNVTARGKRE